jgi:hypothetical protein
MADDSLEPYSPPPFKLSTTDFGGIYAGRGMNRVKVAHVCEPTLRNPDLPFASNALLLLKAPDMHRLLLEYLVVKRLEDLARVHDRTAALLGLLPPPP